MSQCNRRVVHEVHVVRAQVIMSLKILRSSLFPCMACLYQGQYIARGFLGFREQAFLSSGWLVCVAAVLADLFFGGWRLILEIK